MAHVIDPRGVDLGDIQDRGLLAYYQREPGYTVGGVTTPANPARSSADILPVWAANTIYVAGQEILDPTGATILVRQTTGTSRSTYDSTEQSQWSAAGAGGGGGGGSVAVKDEGTTVVATATAFDFVGAGVTATDGGSGKATVTIPGGSTGLTPTAVKTANYTAAVGDLVPVDTTSGNVTVTLPTAPADKTQVEIKHIIRGGSNTVTIACGGSDVINKTGGATTSSLILTDQGKTYQYQAASGIWYAISDDLSLAQLDTRYRLGKNFVSDYGAVADCVTVTDGVIASGSANLTSASAGWVAADVGKAIVVDGAGAGGAPLLTTIASRTSSTVVVLNTTASTAVASAGRVTYGTDNTAKLAQWLTDVGATGGTLIAPEGNYFFGGPQVTGTAFSGAYSGQVLIPGRSQSQSRPTFSIIGSRQPIYSRWGSVLGENEPLATSGTIFTSGAPTGAFIDCIPGLSYNSTPLTNAIFEMRKVIVRVPYNCPVAGLNLKVCGGMILDGVNVEPNILDGSFSQTTSNFKSGSYGVYAPGLNNQTLVVVKDVAVYGHNMGLRISEHAQLDGFSAQACNNGIYIDQAGHPIIFNKVMLQWNTQHIQMNTSGGTGAAVYGSVGFESKTSGWWPTAYDIYDPSNLLRGELSWAANGDATYAIVKNGAAGLRLRHLWRDWIQPSFGAPLARTTYSPGTQASYTVTATALTAVDTTNLKVTFTAPDSGKVLVTLKNLLLNLGTANNVVYGLLNASGGAQVGSVAVALNGTSGYVVPSVEIPVSGLTPGNSYTFQWAARVNTGSASAFAGGDPATGACPASMTVWPEF